MTDDLVTIVTDSPIAMIPYVNEPSEADGSYSWRTGDALPRKVKRVLEHQGHLNGATEIRLAPSKHEGRYVWKIKAFFWNNPERLHPFELRRFHPKRFEDAKMFASQCAAHATRDGRPVKLRVIGYYDQALYT